MGIAPGERKRKKRREKKCERTRVRVRGGEEKGKGGALKE